MSPESQSLAPPRAPAPRSAVPAPAAGAAAAVPVAAAAPGTASAPASPPTRTLGHRVWSVLSSYWLSVSCLLLLFVLTWLGTLYQVDHGLFDAQRKYFDSLFLLQRIGDVFVGADVPDWLRKLPFAVPLPGGMLVMSVLAVNLVCGGFVRVILSMRRGARLVPRIGVLIVHAGIGVLLVAGFVRFLTAIEGSVSLLEGESTSTYSSFHEWEIAVQRAKGGSDGQAGIEEHLIPGEQFLDLEAGDTATFRSPRLPFTVVVEHAARNSEVLPRGATAGLAQSLPGTDAFYLKPHELLAENVQNMAGVVVSVHGPAVRDALGGSGNGESPRAILHALDTAPWTIEAGGEQWGLRLRKKMYPLPFAIRLEHFEAEMHPGTNKPKAFRSDVLVDDPDTGERRVRIQMNEPLRKGDLVVYQSTWDGRDPSGLLRSGFQVVNNPTDQWPLYGCLVIAVGMLLTFGWSLFRFVARESASRRASAATAASTAAAPLLLLGTLAAMFGTARPAAAQHEGHAHAAAGAQTETPPFRQEPWDPRVVETFRALPLQDDGRIKPFLTHVSYLLLRLNGKRSLQVPDEPRFGPLADTTLSPVEWALDVLFFPQQADHYRVFQVQTSEVIDALGLEHEGKKKRDRYSYEELRPGFQKLLSLAGTYEHKDEKARSGVEQQIVLLARNVTDYWRLSRTFDAARATFQAGDSELLRTQIFGGKTTARWSDLIAAWGKVRVAALELQKLEAEADAGERVKRESAALDRLLQQAMHAGGLGDGRNGELAIVDNPLLVWLPPARHADKAWLVPGELLLPPHDAARAEGSAPLATQRHHEALVTLAARGEVGAEFAAEVERLKAHLDQVLAARGEGQKLAQEVAYLRADWFYRALLVFGLSFVLACLGWLRPGSRWLGRLTWGASALGAALVVWGIATRCVLRERPPISTLYDTILFITGAMVITGLVVEALHRRKVFLSLAAFLGFLGMFLAGRFEAMEARDTMPTLVAVLDTNFWLATHVTVINLGYSGALLAGFIGHVWLLGRLFKRGPRHAVFFRNVARAVYGTLCFAALFTTVGTILGGIWANDSWGRFWGWDPKENGALMIVLWCLAILHMRLGGMVRDFGTAMLASAGTMVVVFSWFHTNLLGVGLHSYGFASGLSLAVWSFYGFEVVVLALGWWGQRLALRDSASPASASESASASASASAVEPAAAGA